MGQRPEAGTSHRYRRRRRRRHSRHRRRRRRRLQALKPGHRLERIVKERKAGDDQRRKAEADSPARGREDR